MINFIKAKEEFLKYTSKFPKEDGPIQRKIYHSLRVVDASEKIAESLNLSVEEVELAKLIGLLHDIGRFEQRLKFKTFEDKKSFDHGNFGEQILKSDNYIRTFIEDDKYDEIIFKAIRNHNKFEIEYGLNENEVLFSKIIRDADKLDIIYESNAILFQKFDSIEVEDEIDKDVINLVYLKKLINTKEIDFEKLTNMIFTTFALVFDINYKFTLEKILKENYLEKTANRFDFKNNEVKKEIQELAKFINVYIKEKIEN